MFVGYGDEEFSYRLWDPEKRKIVRNSNVFFHEHETITDIDHSRKTMQYPTGAADVTLVSISSGGTMEGGTILETESKNVIDDTLVDGGLDEREHSPEVAADPLIRSTRDHQSSTRYFSSEYILLTDRGSQRVLKRCILTWRLGGGNLHVST